MRGPAVLLDDLDVSKLSVSGGVQHGLADRYVQILYGGDKLAIEFARLPHHTFAPFEAGPPTRIVDGKKQKLSEQWSILIELTENQVLKWREFENWMHEAISKFKDELCPNKPRNGVVPPTSSEQFADKFNSLLRAADVEKGYPATIRLAVQHELIDMEGRTRMVPPIHLTTLNGNKITKPAKGEITNLSRGCAIVPMASLSRGVYGGGAGWGVKMQLSVAYVILNRSRSSGPEISLDGVEVTEDETPLHSMTNSVHSPAYSDTSDNNVGENNESNQPDAAYGNSAFPP
jgi:hypothetical protein